MRYSQITYLFVGGPEHGKVRMVANEAPRLMVPIMPSLAASYSFGLDTYDLMHTRIRTAEYTRTPIGEVVVYLLTRMDA